MSNSYRALKMTWWEKRVGIGWCGFIAMVGLFALVGCSPSANGLYKPNSRDSSVPTIPLKVAVVEFEDGSSSVGFYQTSSFYGLIPANSTPDVVAFHNTLFGKCLAAELKESRMFAAVEYHPSWERLVHDFETYDLVVTGRLLQDRVKGQTASYRLGVLAAPLWMVGAPGFLMSREVMFEVNAFRSHQPDQVLWNHFVKLEEASWSGIGHDYGGDPHKLINVAVGVKQVGTTDFCTTEILRPQFLTLRKSLADALREKLPGQGIMNVPSKSIGERHGL